MPLWYIKNFVNLLNCNPLKALNDYKMFQLLQLVLLPCMLLYEF